MLPGDPHIDLDTAFARLRTLRSSVDHRPWRPGMPMEQALEALGASLQELRRAQSDIGRLRAEVRVLRRERDAAKRGQAELEQRCVSLQKLESLGRLAGSIAHDFNNLVLIVTGRAELLLEQIPESHPHRKHAREIRKAGRRASALARQLLAFSRPKHGRPGALDSPAALEGTREMLETVVGRTITLEVSLDPEAGAIAIERSELEQMILNLAMNARDAMPRGGTLSIETRRRDLRNTDVPSTRVARPGSYVVISVSDTGIGMDEATRARIFEPYFTTKEERQGTGLGLPSAVAIARQYGGWITVRSAPGQGSRFEIYLPRARAGGAHGGGAPPGAAAAGWPSRQPR
jgi:two-component system, cell cycle sensor histidine kinase and response regulator CckA